MLACQLEPSKELEDYRGTAPYSKLCSGEGVARGGGKSWWVAREVRV